MDLLPSGSDILCCAKWEARRCLSRSLLRLSLASLLCSESMLRRCAKSTFETFELQRPMYVRCKPHVPLLNLNRTHAPSEGDGRTIHDNWGETCCRVEVTFYVVRNGKRDAVPRVLFYGSALLLFSARSPCCDAAPSRPLRPLNFNVRCTFDVNPTCRF